MKYVVSIAFWLFWALSLPVVFVLSLPAVLFSFAVDPDRRFIHAFNCRWSFAYLKLNPGWRIEVKGRERIPQGPCVLIANHQSMADVVVAMALWRQFKFVSKASLFKVPVMGWMMRWAKYVSLERERSGSMRAMLEACRGWLQRGMPVLLFPEGTYATGSALLPFKRGAFHLAVQCQVPLVPVVLRGTRGLIVEDGPLLNTTCHIEVEVQEPIPVAELGTDVDELCARARARFETALNQG